MQFWRGFKLHWDVAAGRIPISCILTGAAVHDSQVALPLMQMSAQRIRWKCETMDAAYDAQLIRAQSKKLGHQALIKPNPSHARSASENAFSEADKQRFKKRAIVNTPFQTYVWCGGGATPKPNADQFFSSARPSRARKACSQGGRLTRNPCRFKQLRH